MSLTGDNREPSERSAELLVGAPNFRRWLEEHGAVETEEVSNIDYSIPCSNVRGSRTIYQRVMLNGKEIGEYGVHFLGDVVTWQGYGGVLPDVKGLVDDWVVLRRYHGKRVDFQREVPFP